MNEDKRYDYYPYIRGENIVKLIGGPLHNQYIDWSKYWGFREIRVAWCEPVNLLTMEYTEETGLFTHIKSLSYVIFNETFWVMPNGIQRLYGAYFAGFH